MKAGKAERYIPEGGLYVLWHSIRRLAVCAYRGIEDNYPKYVISMDRVPLSRDGIIHMNLCDWLMRDWEVS